MLAYGLCFECVGSSLHALVNIEVDCAHHCGYLSFKLLILSLHSAVEVFFSEWRVDKCGVVNCLYLLCDRVSGGSLDEANGSEVCLQSIDVAVM